MPTKKAPASLMSYPGVTRRIVSWARKDRFPAAEIAQWTTAVFALVVVRALLAVWYFLRFVVFAIFVIPNRLKGSVTIERPRLPRGALGASQFTEHEPSSRITKG
jgi:hypothetical protein